MERLRLALPFLKLPVAAQGLRVDIVLAFRHGAVEFVVEGGELGVELPLGGVEFGRSLRRLLKRLEAFVEVGDVGGLGFDLVVRLLVERELVRGQNRVLHALRVGEADERVAAADVEVDVGERVEAEVVGHFVHIDDGDHLEEEAQAGDLGRLAHDVDAVEVAEDDALVDAVLEIAAILRLERRKFVLELVRPILLHSRETDFVKRFKDVERGEEERPRPAGGIENRHAQKRVVEMPHEKVVGRFGKQVFDKGTDVEVEGDEVVDVRDFAGGDLAAKLLTALAARDRLAPDFGGQGVFLRGGLVPSCATGAKRLLRFHGNALFDFVRQRQIDALADGGEDVAVAGLTQELPHETVWLKCGRGFLCRLAYEPRHERVAGDVFGDVFLGVVGAHLRAVVDVLLEDVAQNVRVDVLAGGGDGGVEMPSPLVEEGEEVLEHAVGDIDVRVLHLQLVHLEHAAVQIGNAPELVLERL